MTLQPHSDSDAPSLDRGVISRLRRLDPALVVTWNRYAHSPITGEILLGSGRLDPHTGVRVVGPVQDPAYHLWRRDESTGEYHLINSYPRFTQREVLSLERDVARYIAPRHVFAHIARAQEERRRREFDRLRAYQQDKAAANSSQVRDLVFGGLSQNRGARIFSGGGITRRSTPGDVPMTPREAGWEVPGHND